MSALPSRFRDADIVRVEGTGHSAQVLYRDESGAVHALDVHHLKGPELRRVAGHLGIGSALHGADKVQMVSAIIAAAQGRDGDVPLPAPRGREDQGERWGRAESDETEDGSPEDPSEAEGDSSGEAEGDSESSGDSEDRDQEAEAEDQDSEGDSESGSADLEVLVLAGGTPGTVPPEAVVAAGAPIVEALVAEALEGYSPDGVNEEAVRGIVREALADERPRVTIVVGEEPPRDLPDNHHAMLANLLEELACGEHYVWLAGPTGTGKSTLVEQAAAAMGLDFHPFSVGPADMRSALQGYMDANGNYWPTPLRLAFEHGGLFCLDEIDNASAACITALNAALANGVASFPDGVVTKSPRFYTAATANTWGLGPDALYVGRSRLDFATLNRFPVKLYVDYDPRVDDAVALPYAIDGQEARVRGWIRYCQAVRARVNETRVEGIAVSPRDVASGARRLASGRDPEYVLSTGIFSSCSSDVRAQVDVGLTSYLRGA